ncbi:MAG: helix-turn-helix domain-containing protein [Oscillospiraceae bacterium]|jgi:transcriptional regulator with XRE-family HTH domain|nr:helix-turn-helix domain-containing protein [Oscillospiraceae bacterium]
METKDILLDLRQKNNLTQAKMAEKLLVTRQAVSRWENGETVPNTDTLKIISKTFGVSVNTLLGLPRNTICQVCGMPLEDESNYSRETEGDINEKYCKWCYHDGGFHVADTLDELIENILPLQNWASPEEMRKLLKVQLSTLEYWQK